MNNPDDLSILRNLVGIFDALGIAYAVGGSMASSVYGRVRFTQDADLTVEPFAAKAQQFLERAAKDYYISADAMRYALDHRTSFNINIIHIGTAFKIDLFIRGESEFQKQLIPRRRMVRLSENDEAPFAVVSPEDILLLKLTWYVQGGRTSDRQRDDVKGILATQQNTLDFAYLKKWAVVLEVADVLENALKELT
ncbi:MAG: hypothetical protein IH624_19220 [Phycisphaerae bacterium]|nr:hypothetical protein [Phycisphaerae bacterium]